MAFELKFVIYSLFFCVPEELFTVLLRNLLYLYGLYPILCKFCSVAASHDPSKNEKVGSFDRFLLRKKKITPQHHGCGSRK